MVRRIGLTVRRLDILVRRLDIVVRRLGLVVRLSSVSGRTQVPLSASAQISL